MDGEEMLTEIRALKNTLFSQSCAGCEAPLTDDESALPYPLCTACHDRLPVIDDVCCSQCGVPLISEISVCLKCRQPGTRYIDTNRSLYVYADLAQRLIWSYKFSHQRRLARFFAEQIHARIPTWEGDGVVVPIPGSPKNTRRRGWDQMRTIARRLHAQYEVPILDMFRHLRRRTQKSLGKSERAVNAVETFALRPRLVLPANVNSILLLDDVYTTGATVNACARLARSVGIEQVRSLTLSIAL